MQEYLFVLVPVFLALLALINIYFRIADKYNIIDKPNERSSHSSITLRGGGIIFPISALLFLLVNNFSLTYVCLGVVVAGAVSFWDDIKTIGSGVRLLFQTIAVLLLFYQLDLFQYHWGLVIVFLIIAIANINAFNFMDALNGISVLHYISIVGTAIYIQLYVQEFIELNFLFYVMCGFFVFGIYNLRRKAKCFAGDIGSVSAAIICMYVVYQLVHTSGDFKYMLLMLVFGMDSLITIAIRFVQRENILEPHRKHLCQYLANEAKVTHLKVSAIYFIVQMGFNLVLLQTDLIGALVASAVMVLLYFVVRIYIYRKYVQTNNQN